MVVNDISLHTPILALESSYCCSIGFCSHRLVGPRTAGRFCTVPKLDSCMTCFLNLFKHIYYLMSAVQIECATSSSPLVKSSPGSAQIRGIEAQAAAVENCTHVIYFNSQSSTSNREIECGCQSMALPTRAKPPIPTLSSHSPSVLYTFSNLFEDGCVVWHFSVSCRLRLPVYIFLPSIGGVERLAELESSLALEALTVRIKPEKHCL